MFSDNISEWVLRGKVSMFSDNISEWVLRVVSVLFLVFVSFGWSASCTVSTCFELWLIPSDSSSNKISTECSHSPWLSQVSNRRLWWSRTIWDLSRSPPSIMIFWTANLSSVSVWAVTIYCVISSPLFSDAGVIWSDVGVNVSCLCLLISLCCSGGWVLEGLGLDLSVSPWLHFWLIPTLSWSVLLALTLVSSHIIFEAHTDDCLLDLVFLSGVELPITVLVFLSGVVKLPVTDESVLELRERSSLLFSTLVLLGEKPSRGSIWI